MGRAGAESNPAQQPAALPSPATSTPSCHWPVRKVVHCHCQLSYLSSHLQLPLNPTNRTGLTGALWYPEEAAAHNSSLSFPESISSVPSDWLPKPPGAVVWHMWEQERECPSHGKGPPASLGYMTLEGKPCTPHRAAKLSVISNTNH